SDLPCVKDGKCPLTAFRCHKGHVWAANGQPVCFYCPTCADSRVYKVQMQAPTQRKRDLALMQQIAKDKGGECLSTVFRGMVEKLRFRCAEGHEWETAPNNIFYHNTWCPACVFAQRAVRKRLTIEDMHFTAKQFGGEFLSTKYESTRTKYKWRCKRGHVFWQVPNNMRRSEGKKRAATFCKV
ncbi:unnamed protein product, partial [Sphacelaria rigidula]